MTTSDAGRTDTGRSWRPAAGITVDDQAGALRVYVAETQRAFVMAGIAAEMTLDLLSFASTEEAERKRFVEAYSDRYDEKKLEETWAAAVAGGLLVSEIGVDRQNARTGGRDVALLGSVGSEGAISLIGEMKDLGLEVTEPGRERPRLMLGLDDLGDDKRLVDLGRSLPWEGTPWLPVQLLHDRICMGPLVFPGDTPCFECALTRRAAGLMPDGVRRWGEQTLNRPGRIERRAAAKVASSIILNQVQSMRSGEAPSLTGRRLVYDLRRATQQTSFVLEVPGCRTCRLTDGFLQ